MEEQRFIEEIRDAYFEMEELFADGIKTFQLEDRRVILESIIPILSVLPIDNGWSQFVGGVIDGYSPVFYTIEYINEPDEPTVLVNVTKIYSDDYLDLILENNTIKYYEESKED
tara:strand:+ start:1328 stop:1669 length:342 start_codon:yes stop_codon:yes gene_type:complete